MPIVAVAGLEVVAAAMLAILLLWGLYLLARLVRAPFAAIPGIGGWLGNEVDSLMHGARDAAMSLFDSVLHGARSLFNGTLNVLDHLFGQVRGAIGDLANTIDHIAVVTLPRLWRNTLSALAGLRHWTAAGFDQLRHWTAAGFDTARHWTAAQLAGLRHWTAAGFDTARHWTAAQLADARHWTAAELASLRAWTAGEINHVSAWALSAITAAQAAAEAYALGLFRTAESDIATAQAAAQAYAAAAATAAEREALAAVNSAATAGLAVAWPGIITDLDAIRGQLAADMPDIRDAIDAIPQAVPADLAAALGAVTALAVPMLRAMDDCVIPNCENLGNLGEFVKNLTGAVQSAAILAWLAYCIADPVAAADDTATVADPIVGTVLGGLEGLFGVRP